MITDVPKDLTAAVSGKTIDRVEDEDGIDSWLEIHFTDGTALRIRYDWIYEWELSNDTNSGTVEK